jgi:hypothetical protein
MNLQTVDIPIDVEVKCCGRNCGRSTHIVLNPVTKEITHLVVKQRAFPHTERLIPVDLMIESTPCIIHLRCDAPDLDAMDEFIETAFIGSEETHVIGGPFMMWPYTYTTEEYIPHDHEQIPVGELAIRRGARVEAQDGQVGRVDEFVVDRHSEHITHLVAVYLNIDKASVAALPGVPIHR